MGGIGIFEVVGILFMVLFWVAIVALIVWAVRSFGRREEAHLPKKSALDIARERYARGEITREEFDQIKRDLM